MSQLFLIQGIQVGNGTFSDTDKIIASVSQASGYMSLFVWLFAQLPQIIENHLNQSVNGVSLLFLGCWMGGDVTNLIGCILTGALPFQTCLASYYCFIDCILSLQYWYYTKVYPYQRVHHNLLQSPNMMRPVNLHSPHLIALRTNRFRDLTSQRSHSPMDINGGRRKRMPEVNNSITKRLFGALFVGSIPKGAKALPTNVSEETSSKEKFTSILHFFSSIMCSLYQTKINKAGIGRFLAWTCTALYISSRTPQIIKNYQSKSTQGISLYLFLFAMLGNSLYTICIVTDLYLIAHDNGYLDEWVFRDALYSQLPFIIGSAGTVSFDCLILFQCWLYSDNGRKSSTSSAIHGNLYGDGEELDISINDHNRHSGGENNHFKKPDWYTNNHIQFPDSQLDENHMHRDRFRREHKSRPSDTSGLLSSAQHSTYSSIASQAPPSHYITGSSHSTYMSPPSGNVVSNTLQSLSNSFLRSKPVNTTIPGKSPAISIASSGNFSATSPLSTSLIPLIIGTYSSVSKKMKNEAKIPFLPIDFLHDDFHHSVDGSQSSINNN